MSAAAVLDAPAIPRITPVALAKEPKATIEVKSEPALDQLVVPKSLAIAPAIEPQESQAVEAPPPYADYKSNRLSAAGVISDTVTGAMFGFGLGLYGGLKTAVAMSCLCGLMGLARIGGFMTRTANWLNHNSGDGATKTLENMIGAGLTVAALANLPEAVFFGHKIAGLCVLGLMCMYWGFENTAASINFAANK